MQTMINGQLARWPEAVAAAWQERQPVLRPDEEINEVNYFTPQPWRNEYDRGSLAEGFTYVVTRQRYYRHVAQVRVQGGPPWFVREPRRGEPLVSVITGEKYA